MGISKKDQQRLQELVQLKELFDGQSQYTRSHGWNLDHYVIALPNEKIGEIQENGSFVRACEILKEYSFVPKHLITGIFDPSVPLEQRRMLLKGQFLFLTFWFGVKISRVIHQQQRLSNGYTEQVWGYSYRTLEKHFEEGEITFTIHKILETGKVTMKIDAISRTGTIKNPFFRIGFKLFGRFLQIYFAYSSLYQMQKMVSARRSTSRPNR